MSKDLTEALRKLSEAQVKDDQSKALATRGQAPAVTSAALLAGAANTAGGIASPLVETAYTDRTFHATTNITSTDGLFTLKIKPVKEIKFLDLAGRPVTIEYKAPV